MNILYIIFFQLCHIQVLRFYTEGSRSKSRKNHRSNSNSAPNKSTFFYDLENTCIHVSNLSSKVTDDDLKEIFGKMGDLKYANVCMEPKTYSIVTNIQDKARFLEDLVSLTMGIQMMLTMPTNSYKDMI